MPQDNETAILEALQAKTGGYFQPGFDHKSGRPIPSVHYDPTKRAISLVGEEEYLKPNPGPLQGAGTVQVSDITAVDIAILLQEVIGAEMPFFNLRNTCRHITMNELEMTVPLYTKMGAANEKVPELQEAQVRVGDYTNIVFALWKNVSHIVISDEAKKRANVDVFGYDKQDCAIALAHSEETQIGAELTGTDITSVSGTTWDTMGTYYSQYNPYKDLEAVITTLSQNGFTGPYDVVAHNNVWAGFWANTYVKGFATPTMNIDYTQPGPFPIPGQPGCRGWSSPWVTTTEAYVLQRDKAIILGDGPTEAAAYRQ